MTFWTNDTLREAFEGGVVTPFDADNIHQAAYELGVAGEYAITTPDGEGARVNVPEGGDIKIPAGQFALLLTREIVKVPSNAMGFISVKGSWKLKGLVNVSGFHVDPGFHGRLKFSVYNASGKTLHIKPAKRLFQLWLNALGGALPDGKTYPNRHPPDAGIQDDDVAAISGMVASPAGLSTRIDSLGERLTGEIPKLETSLAKTITDTTHKLALDIERVNGTLGAKLEGVRTQQWLQWFVIAALAFVFVIEPIKACAKSKSGSAGSSTQSANSQAPVVSIDAAVAVPQPEPRTPPPAPGMPP